MLRFKIFCLVILGFTQFAIPSDIVSEVGIGISDLPKFKNNGTLGANLDLGCTYFPSIESKFGFQFIDATLAALPMDDSIGPPILIDQNYSLRFDAKGTAFYISGSGGTGPYLLMTRGKKTIVRTANRLDSTKYETDLNLGWGLKVNLYTGKYTEWGSWGLKSTMEYMFPLFGEEKGVDKIETGLRISLSLYFSGSEQKTRQRKASNSD